MAGWIDPRPNDFSVEGLRARFKSLQDWLRNPEFANGVRLGDGTPATYDDSTGVTVPPTFTDVDAAVLAGMEQDLTDLENRFPIQEVDIGDDQISTPKLQANSVTANELAAMNIGVGKWIASTSYTPGSDGWIIDADGTAEFNDVTVRGQVVASEFRGAPTASILGVNGSFDTDTSGWTAYTAEFPNSQISRVTSPVRSGSGALRIQSSSGAGARAAYTEVAVAPGDIVHAAGWVLKDDLSEGAADTWWDTVTINVDFYDSTGTLVHQYFHESIQSAGWYDGSGYSPTPEWRLLEVYAAAPLNLDIAKARIYFSSYSNAAALGRYALYVDDVTIGIAPLLEVPYMVTHEDDERKRAIVTPQQFAFESQFSNYPYGLLARHNAHTPSLRITGPYGFGNQAPQLELEHDLLNNMRYARLGVDQVLAGSNGHQGQPAYSFEGNPDTGMYGSSTFVALATNGAYKLALYDTYARLQVPLRFANGDLSSPGLCPTSDTDSGFYYHGSGMIGMAANGAQGPIFGRAPAGTGGVSGPSIALVHGSTTTGGNANLYLAYSGGNYWLYRMASRREMKRDIRPLSESIDSGAVIDALKPVTFKGKVPENEEDRSPHEDYDAEYVGFVVEDVAEVDGRFVDWAEDEPQMYDTKALVATLVAEVQSLRKRVADLEANVDA